MGEVMARQRHVDEEKVLAAARHFGDLVREHQIGSEFRIVWRNALGDDGILRALHCDLIVAAHPKPADLPAGWSAERLLLTTGIPVLLVPNGWQGETIGENVLIAWNRSREEIGRASCRERVCQYVSITVVAVLLKKKKKP